MIWGSETDQAVLQICAIHETNGFGNIGLIAFRLICFVIMGWLVITDIKMKHGLHYEKYTVWGEVSTFITFALLTQCSVEKYLAESIFKYNNSGSIRCLFGNIGLAKRASFMFQWAFLCELTLTLLFWSFNLFVCTDISKMSYE